jgi:hypothetical protein
MHPSVLSGLYGKTLIASGREVERVLNAVSRDTREDVV